MAFEQEYYVGVFKGALEATVANSILGKILNLDTGIEYKSGVMVFPGIANVPRMVTYTGAQSPTTLTEATKKVTVTPKYAGFKLPTADYNACPAAFDNAVKEIADSAAAELWTPVGTILVDALGALFNAAHAVNGGVQSNVSDANVNVIATPTDVEVKAALTAAVSQMKRMTNWNKIPCNAEMSEVIILTGVAAVQDQLDAVLNEQALSDGSKPFSMVKCQVVYRPELTDNGFIVVRTDDKAMNKAIVAGISAEQIDAKQDKKDSEFSVLNASGATIGHYQFAHKVTLT